jgi:hypothetical protein
MTNFRSDEENFSLKATGLFPIVWEQAHLPTDHCEDGIGIEGAMFMMKLRCLR